MNKQEFLVAVACGVLSDEHMLQGFAEHYLVRGVGVQEMCKDMCLAVSAKAAQETGERMMRLFRILAGKGEKDHGKKQGNETDAEAEETDI